MASISWEELRKEAEASGNGFKLVPAGTYDVVVNKATPKTSSNGNDQIMLQLSVVGGPSAGDSVVDYITFTPKAAGIVLSKLTAFGYTLPAGGDIDTTAIARDLVGASAAADIVQEDYNGETRNKVKGLKASAGGPTASTGSAGFPF